MDEICSASFVLKVLIFGIEATIDESKLCVLGHKIGATAANELAKEDNRIK